MEARSGEAYRPSAGSVYPKLQQLEDEGLITSRREEGKNVYTTTDAGQHRMIIERTGRNFILFHKALNLVWPLTVKLFHLE